MPSDAIAADITTIRARDGELLDALCLRHYGDTAMTEKVLAANRGLADLGPHLPHGTLVRLPPREPVPILPTTKLWN